jgi:hypothetical protein
VQVHDAVVVELRLRPRPLGRPEALRKQTWARGAGNRVHEQVKLIDEPVGEKRADQAGSNIS